MKIPQPLQYYQDKIHFEKKVEQDPIGQEPEFKVC